MGLLSGTEPADQPDPTLAEVDERLAAGDVAGVREALRTLPEERRRELGETLGGVSLESLVRGEKEEERGTVVVLHGIMGSNLFAVADGDADRIWVSPVRLANGEFRRLALPGGSELIEPRGLYRGYLALVLWLDRHWKVVPFAFDWRSSLADSAAKLATTLDDIGPGPAHLVAHSMGGLVARTMIQFRPDVWARIDDPDEHRRGGRLVMLGTPNHGSFAIPLAFTGKERMVKALALADLRNRLEDVQQVLAGFPGSYEMLPSTAVDPDGDHVALFDAETWGAAPIRPELLAAAGEAQAALAGAVDPLRMVYVAGSGHDTPHRVQINGPGDFKYARTRNGDGRVTHERGRLEGVATFYSSANHGDLITDAGVLAVIDDLLLTGATAGLPAVPPDSVRGVTAEDEGWHEPDDLEARGLVGARQRGPAQPETRDAEAFVADAVSDYLPPPRPEVRPALPELRIRVLHASCDAATHPVVVGHYKGAPIAGAEAFLDRRLGGRLSARQLCGLYPDDLGEHLLIPAARGQRPPGAIVVGLGPRGDLTPTGLTQAVTDMVLAHALSVADAAEAGGGTRSAAFSAVLVGTSGADGLSVESSVLAITEGTVAAMQLLAEHPSGTRVSIDEIEFVEMYAQRGARAAYAVREIRRFLSPDRLAHVELHPAQRLERGEGARPGDLPLEYEAGSWRRLVVTARDPDPASVDGDVELVFTSMGLQARADQLTQRVDRRLLELLLADAMRPTPEVERVNRTLYELLLPSDLKHDLSTVENLHLVVDDRTGDYPWELLADRDGPGAAEPLARRSGMLRQLSLGERRHLAPPRGENTALVIGNPPGGKGYPPLPGAMKEASAVAATLADGGFRVEAHVFEHDADPKTTPSKVSIALLDGDFRILHVAGHGNYKPGIAGAPPVGGVVIGDDVYLTAGTIGQMRRPPDLVFLNCCHLGRVGAVGVTAYEEAKARAFTRHHLNQLAASLAREVMAMGVRAVVAAGWPVADDAAAIFAQVLYERLLDGEAYGDAVKHARRAACKADGGASNTWAAYQCYGDPAFRLGARGAAALPSIDPVSEDELVRALEDVAVRAGDPGADTTRLEQQVRDLESALPPGWGRGHVLAAFGAAYAELGRFDDAVRLYRGALSAEDGTVELRAVEQLANLEVRYATALHRQAGGGAGDEDHARAQALFEESEDRLKHLRGLAETAERNALLAAHYKRWALAGQREHLSQAIDHYLKAGKTYTKLNALQLATVSGIELDGDLAARVEECKAWLKGYEPERAAARYWDRIGVVDAALTRAVVGGTLADEVDSLRQDYVRVLLGDRSTPRDRDSTVEHLLELAELATEPTRSALVRLGTELRQARAPVAAPVTGS
ncbi:MAG TPA: CHAT domain-containing protein [Acidimicrobiales bacterium]|nr:CHAT domain-containing protein [Acidimicrobiales bacterium]